jgi:hypothetical protein
METVMSILIYTHIPYLVLSIVGIVFFRVLRLRLKQISEGL